MILRPLFLGAVVLIAIIHALTVDHASSSNTSSSSPPLRAEAAGMGLSVEGLAAGGSDGGIIIPRCDKREYESLVLPNGLTVLLISDPETDKAAAAMNVAVGSLSDPDDAPGLAHFLEHMLFYASEKYPIEDSYSDFLSKHGGRSNAYTGAENTNYQFDVAAEHLEGAMDRFAQFFICPLMSADATNREINAVHSEHTKNLISDVWRINQLHKSFCSPTHPFHKFNVGSLETLKEAPEAAGRDIRLDLVAFYDKHYSANQMQLVLYGKDPIPLLRALVETRFAAVPNKSLPPIQIPGDPCGTEYTKKLIRVVPVTEGHKLDLTWCVPADQHQHRSAPSRYLGHMIGHEGHGSLFALLKKKAWATSLGAGRSHSSAAFAFFSISIELSDMGQEHAMDVVELVFRYVALLASGEGIKEWVFDELSAVCSTKFHFLDKQPPFFYASAIAENMQLYPRADWLAGSSLPRSFDPAGIKAMVEALTPDNMQIFWISKQFESEATEEERWYKTKHAAQGIPEDLLQKWRNALASPATSLTATDSTAADAAAAAAAAAVPAPADGAPSQASSSPSPSILPSDLLSLHLPSPNEFVPTDFTLITQTTGKRSPPRVILSTPMLRLWHKPDTLFGLPKAVLFLQLSSPHAYLAPHNALCTRLMATMLVDYLNEYAYCAEIAGLSYSVSPTVQGIQITASGYSHKLLLLVTRIVERIATFTVREDRFEVAKEKSLKEFENYRYDQPYAQSMYSASLLMEHTRWHFEDYLNALPGVTKGQLEAFLPAFIGQVTVECFVAGNISPSASSSFLLSVQSCLQSSPIRPSSPPPSSLLPEKRVVRLKQGSEAVFATKGLNAADENSAILFYLQVCQDGERTTLTPPRGSSGEADGATATDVSVPTHVIGQLLVQILDRDVFYELRTVQQLGYIVFLMSRNEHGVHGITFIIQSNVKSASGLHARVEAFLSSARGKLEQISEEELKTHVSALIARKTERKKNLVEEASGMWKEIDDGAMEFERVEKEVAALRLLQQHHVSSFFAEAVAKGAKGRRLISVQVESQKEAAAVSAATAEPSAAAADGPATEAAADAATACTTPAADAPKEPATCAANEAAHADVGAEIITDIFAFKRNQMLFPSLKGRPLPPSLMATTDTIAPQA